MYANRIFSLSGEKNSLSFNKRKINAINDLIKKYTKNIIPKKDLSGSKKSKIKKVVKK